MALSRVKWDFYIHDIEREIKRRGSGGILHTTPLVDAIIIEAMTDFSGKVAGFHFLCGGRVGVSLAFGMHSRLCNQMSERDMQICHWHHITPQECYAGDRG